MKQLFTDFRGALLIAIVAMVLGYMVDGPRGVFLTLVLGGLEVALSFDNAVVNAKVLNGMSDLWRRRFLTWGMPIAVFGMRAVFPVAIVAVGAGLSMLEVVRMALRSPADYAHHLHEAHVAISAFGGTFLVMVFLRWIIDPEKETHWLHLVEGPLSKIAIEGIHAIVALAILLLINPHVPAAGGFLPAGAAGLATYLAVDGLGSLFGDPGAGKAAGKAGLATFIYLEVLDASFSFDGVIGAFAVTKEVLIITAGLAVGAMFVRSLTLLLVKHGTLAEYRYLEHGAHWGIGALAAVMFAGIFHEVPEVATGGISAGLILAALVSSMLANRQEMKEAATF